MGKADMNNKTIKSFKYMKEIWNIYNIYVQANHYNSLHMSKANIVSCPNLSQLKDPEIIFKEQRAHICIMCGLASEVPFTNIVKL